MAIKSMDIYGCEKCTCIAEMLTDCDGNCEITCCGEPMKKLDPKTEDQGQEKHVPVIEKISGGYKVKVGDVPHPMEEKHHIQFVELRAGSSAYRTELKAGDAPEAVFMVGDLGADVYAIEHCNIHGLWTSKK